MGRGQRDLETGQFDFCGAYFRVVQRPLGKCSWTGSIFTNDKGHHSQFPSAGQFIILVIDSTDRDRLLTTREELYKMLAHEVSPPPLGDSPVY